MESPTEFLYNSSFGLWNLLLALPRNWKSPTIIKNIPNHRKKSKIPKLTVEKILRKKNYCVYVSVLAGRVAPASSISCCK